MASPGHSAASNSAAANVHVRRRPVMALLVFRSKWTPATARPKRAGWLRVAYTRSLWLCVTNCRARLSPTELDPATVRTNADFRIVLEDAVTCAAGRAARPAREWQTRRCRAGACD